MKDDEKEALRRLQRELPWGAHGYSKAYWKDPRPHRDLDHALKHVRKPEGRLVEMLDAFDHTDDVAAKASELRPDAEKRFADALWSLLRAANEWPGGPIVLADVYAARVAEKMGRRPATARKAPPRRERAVSRARARRAPR